MLSGLFCFHITALATEETLKIFAVLAKWGEKCEQEPWFPSKAVTCCCLKMCSDIERLLRVLERNMSTWSCFSYLGPSLTRWIQVLLMLYWPQICSGELALTSYPRRGCKINIHIYINNCFRILSKKAHRAEKPNQPLTVRWSKFLEIKTQQQCYQAKSVLSWLFSFFLIPLFLVLPLLIQRFSDTQNISSPYPCALWGVLEDSCVSRAGLCL